MGETYAKLVVQPIDLINAFKLDFCFASLIKWLTKWHLEHKTEYLVNAKYYIRLCVDTPSHNSNALLFAVGLYCMVNGFTSSPSGSCLLMDIVKRVVAGDIEASLKVIDKYA